MEGNAGQDSASREGNTKRLVRQEEQRRRVNDVAQVRVESRKSGRAGRRARQWAKTGWRECQGAEQGEIQNIVKGEGRAGHGRTDQTRGRAGNDRTGQGKTGQPRSGQGRAGQGRAGALQGHGQGQGWTGQDRAEKGRAVAAADRILRDNAKRIAADITGHSALQENAKGMVDCRTGLRAGQSGRQDRKEARALR